LQTFPFDAYPRHVRELTNFAWKPLAMQLALEQHPVILYVILLVVGLGVFFIASLSLPLSDVLLLLSTCVSPVVSKMQDRSFDNPSMT
jgi:hypothetical protein